ncbi:helix-turn-helix domain-containing protein [Prauserella aidingensis]|uniref:helix-turn-helix domain-containing protein n=1 Tax=Prauserella aidingensis TaxID=387890 RepID=UPI003559032F
MNEFWVGRRPRAPGGLPQQLVLERQGDVSATAAAMNVHRTTLYYRLRQACRILGEDPAGHARFRIHAALRFARLCWL